MALERGGCGKGFGVKSSSATGSRFWGVTMQPCGRRSGGPQLWGVAMQPLRVREKGPLSGRRGGAEARRSRSSRCSPTKQAKTIGTRGRGRRNLGFRAGISHQERPRLQTPRRGERRATRTAGGDGEDGQPQAIEGIGGGRCSAARRSQFS